MALQDRQARTRIGARLARVEAGNLGDCKPVREGVQELRIDYGPGYRVYLSRQKGRWWWWWWWWCCAVATRAAKSAPFNRRLSI